MRKGASDIHIEPYEKALRVRFRIDGMLYEMMSPPFKMKAAIISRLKIMAELDIAERRVPQDGRIKIRLLGRSIDLRVSTLPTIFGEKVVMRILDKGNLNIDLNKLGFQEPALTEFITRHLAALRDGPGDRARPGAARPRRSTRRSPRSTSPRSTS